MSVPDWKKLFIYDDQKIKVMHTAVSGFEEDAEFIKRLNFINLDYLADIDGGLFSPASMLRLFDDRKKYDAYKTIDNNYISAFCEDCIRLFDLLARKGHPTLAQMLADPRCDEERLGLTTLRDLDFGITGDAHISVFLRKA